MSITGSINANYLHLKQNRKETDAVLRAAQLGMWPFRAKNIEIYDEFAIDYNKYRITVGWYLMGGTEYFPFTEYIGRDEMLMDPFMEIVEFANKVFNYYRFEIPTIPMYIEDTPTHPHISLGEN